MDNLIGKWGGADLSVIYQYEEKECIHPDDWSTLSNYPYKTSKHLCIGQDDVFLTIQFGDSHIRIIPSHFEISQEPKFKPLEHVKFYNSKGQLEFGIIKGIHWHNNEQKDFYDVEVNGKIKGRRYYDEDLEKME
jgi:hypothetical protein